MAYGAPNVVRLIPRNRFYLLNERLNSVFIVEMIRDINFANAIYALADENMHHIGDIIKLTPQDIDKYTKDPQITAVITKYLNQKNLPTGGVVQGWSPPPTRYTWR